MEISGWIKRRFAGDGLVFRVWRKVFNFMGIVGVAVLVYGGIAGILGERGERVVSAQQQDPFLSQRISQMEQRFYSIETRLNRLESDSRTATGVRPGVPNNNDVDIQYLRSQVDSLRLRIGETECGLLRIDERTLSAAAKQARKKGTITEVCRVDPGAPVQLSARPPGQ
jgi:hypothetical protein